MKLPILYSYRRCPYAMRARMALDQAEITHEMRDILLKDKPAAFLAASPKATVPVLVLPDDTVLEESLDIMLWALGENDPEGWLAPRDGSQEDLMELIAQADGPFKQHLDRFKYHTRHGDVDVDAEWAGAVAFLSGLEARLVQGSLFGDRDCLADFAIFPFVRQLANSDRSRFDAMPLATLQTWLGRHVASARFARIMRKWPTWRGGDDALVIGTGGTG